MTQNNEMIRKDDTIMMKISHDMIIGDILAQDPEMAGVLMGMGMHCIGCPALPLGRGYDFIDASIY